MKKAITILSFALAVYSCKKDTTSPQPAASSNGIPGNITGNVVQINQYGITNTVNLNGVTVSIDGTNYSTTTDVNGNYTLSNVIPGTYNVSFNRAGCGLWQQQQLTFAGNGTYHLNGYATEKPTYNFTGAIKDSIGRIYVCLNMTPLPTDGGVLILRSKYPNLTITDPTSYQLVLQETVPANVSSCALYIMAATSGTWYYKAYPCPNIYDGAYYDDVVSGKRKYTAYGNQLPGTFTITLP